MALKYTVRTIRVVDTRALYRDIGARIRRLRTVRGQPQADLARALGVTRASIANMELGRNRILLEHVYTLAEYWKVPFRRLLP